MSSVAKQTRNRSLLAYVGALLGIVNQLFIFPLAFDVYGEIQFIQAMIGLIVPIASFGVMNVVTRFYPYFEENGRLNHSYLILLLAGASIAFVAFTGIILVFKTQYFHFIESMGFDLIAFQSYNAMILSGAYLAILASIVGSYLVILKQISLPYGLTTLIWKFAIPALILLYVFHRVVVPSLYWVIPIVYLLIFVLLCWTLYQAGVRKFLPIRSQLLRTQTWPLTKFALYSVLTSMGAMLAFRIDKVMLRGLTTDFDTGVYAAFTFLAGIILFPLQSMVGSYGPHVAKAWSHTNISSLRRLHKKSSRTLLLIGFGLFYLIALSIDDLLRLTTHYATFKMGINAFLFLGLANALDSAFGLNGLILTYSKYYYWGLIATIGLAIVNILLNLKLIPFYGLTGAAMATGASILLYNLIFYAINWFKFRIQSFDWKSLYLILVLSGTFILARFCAVTNYPIWNVLSRTMVFFLLSTFVIFRFRLAPEATTFANHWYQRVQRIFLNN